jgi:hypothetical protein
VHAQEKKETDMADKPKNADFIGRVVSDASNPPQTRMLTGWFGDSPDEGYRRLYTDPELSTYLDIPEDAILYFEPVRDSQPAGCVMVWIKSDAAVKQGGTAASRAARFLQGNIQQDFASGAAGSLEKAGLRCVTEAPCGEVTGFTGQCTKQPDVGGAWPCITAIPHCYEVTGFTGKCTHQPWPNPTRYIGCTYLHCPTNDLTHVPHICNIVATGQPGCAVVNPPQGGDPAKAVAADAEAKEVPATAIPGCGYTKSWGVCETHLLGCGPNAQAKPDAAFITGEPRVTTFCFQTHFYPQCMGRITNICGITFRPFCAAGEDPNLNAGGGQRFAPAETWTNVCTMAHPPVCYPTEGCHTKFPQCHGGGAAFAAAAPAITGAAPCVSVGGVCTNVHGCTVPPTSPDFKCTQSGPACPTHDGPHCPSYPPTACTQSGPACPTSCGADCQSQQPGCTQIGEVCGHKPCTQNPEQCPSLGIICTPNCPVTTPQIHCATPAQRFAAGHPSLQNPLCTHVGPQCPTYANACVTGWRCRAGNDSTDFCPTSMGCGGARAQAFAGAQPATTFPCQTQRECSVYCCPTESGPRCPHPAAAAFDQSTDFCPTSMGCGGAQAQAVGGVHPTLWTQIGPHCQTHMFHCTNIGCPNTKQFECTFACTHGAPGCPQPAAQAFDQSTEFCPTSGGCGGVVHPQAAIGGGFTPGHPTPATRCFVCPPFDFAAQAQARPIQTAFIQCINQPTPATRCFFCPPPDFPAAAPDAAFATGPGYGCTYAGPNCPNPTHVAGCGATLNRRQCWGPAAFAANTQGACTAYPCTQVGC